MGVVGGDGVAEFSWRALDGRADSLRGCKERTVYGGAPWVGGGRRRRGEGSADAHGRVGVADGGD